MPDSERRRRLTVQEYLDMEMNSSTRHEYVCGEVFAMTGSSSIHNRICVNLSSALDNFLEGSGCSVYVIDIKVRAEKADSFYYPDLLVTCEPLHSEENYVANDPLLIIEVLSRSTKQTDMREKLVAYKMISTLQQYIIVHQDRMKIEVHQRVDEETWDHFIMHRTGMLDLCCGGERKFSLSLERVYKGLDLPPVVREEEEEYSVH